MAGSEAGREKVARLVKTDTATSARIRLGCAHATCFSDYFHSRRPDRRDSCGGAAENRLCPRLSERRADWPLRRGRDGSGERPLLATRDIDYDPVWSPDGQSIVFTSDREGSADLFRVKPDGTGLERLTDSPAYDDQAAFSPDGRQLVFVTTRAGGTAESLDARHRDPPREAADVRRRRQTSARRGRPTASGSRSPRAAAATLTFAHGRWEHLQFADIYVDPPGRHRPETRRRARRLLRQPEMDGRQPPRRRLLHGRAEDARDAAAVTAAGQRHAHRFDRCGDRYGHRCAGRTRSEVQSVGPVGERHRLHPQGQRRRPASTTRVARADHGDRFAPRRGRRTARGSSFIAARSRRRPGGKRHGAATRTSSWR